jgi:hypothetical protein
MDDSVQIPLAQAYAHFTFSRKDIKHARCVNLIEGEMSKLDLRKELKTYYTAKRRPGIVDVTPGNFLSILGKGDPNGEEYQQAMQALYGISYTLKFDQKAQGRDYTVMPLEGL